MGALRHCQTIQTNNQCTSVWVGAFCVAEGFLCLYLLSRMKPLDKPLIFGHTFKDGGWYNDDMLVGIMTNNVTETLLSKK